MIGLGEISRNNEFYSRFNWSFLLLGNRNVFNSSGDKCQNLENVSMWKDNYHNINASDSTVSPPIYDLNRQCITFSPSKKLVTDYTLNDTIIGNPCSYEFWAYVDFSTLNYYSIGCIVGNYNNTSSDDNKIQIILYKGALGITITTSGTPREYCEFRTENSIISYNKQVIRVKARFQDASSTMEIWSNNIQKPIIKRYNRGLQPNLPTTNIVIGDTHPTKNDYSLRGKIAMLGFIKGHISDDDSILLYNRIKTDYNNF